LMADFPTAAISQECRLEVYFNKAHYLGHDPSEEVGGTNDVVRRRPCL